MARKLLVQGWRFIHHSYAIVAQQHCLSLLRRGDVALRFEDLPLPSPRWQPSRGILDPDDERALGELESPEAAFSPEATLRFGPDFTAPPSGRRFVFDTPEFQVLRLGIVRKLRANAGGGDRVHMLVPSHWAAQAYLRFGIAAERVHVVPHGVDPRLFRPDAARREEARARLGLANAFVFMSVGAMTGNKGIGILLRAFARVAAGNAAVRLVLKGADDLYASHDLLRAQLDALPAAERQAVAARVVYLGERRPARDMADLLRAADCYVSPYLAEGFNMPVLEAAACGVPVVCTAGGATDDFADPAFALRIRSQRAQLRIENGLVGFAMQPDVDHLVELMLEAARDPQRSREMGAAGASRVARDFTWDRVTERLVDVLFPS